MALNGDTLGDAIKAALIATGIAVDDETVQELWRAIAAEIVSHYLMNAEVTVTIPAGTVLVSVTGGSGAPAVGTLNPSPISLTVELT